MITLGERCRVESVGGFEHLAVCGDVTAKDIDAACVSREDFEAFLARFAQIAAPNTGAASILVALSRLATTACEWADGDIAIELLDVDEVTEVRVMTELGAGMRELLFPPVRLRTPLAELSEALDANPALAGSLKVNRRSWKRVTLDALEHVRRSTRPPRISDTSLVVTGVPQLRSSPRPTSEETTVDVGWDASEKPDDGE